jgi:hypothetical protein
VRLGKGPTGTLRRHPIGPKQQNQHQPGVTRAPRQVVDDTHQNCADDGSCGDESSGWDGDSVQVRRLR